jgi:hypothetical protein
MLQKLDEHIRNCHVHADACRKQANVIADPDLKAVLLVMELNWLRLAQSTEQLGESVIATGNSIPPAGT